MILSTASALVVAAERTKITWRRTVKRVSKLEPRYFITMKSGQVYEAKKIQRQRTRLIAESTDGRTFTLARRDVKSIRFGIFTLKHEVQWGKYVARSKALKTEDDKLAWDKYELWRAMGGAQHWSDVYGNNKQIRR